MSAQQVHDEICHLCLLRASCARRWELGTSLTDEVQLHAYDAKFKHRHQYYMVTEWHCGHHGSWGQRCDTTISTRAAERPARPTNILTAVCNSDRGLLLGD